MGGRRRGSGAVPWRGGGEKRSCRALKSLKRQGALAKSNTNERSKLSRSVVCGKETLGPPPPARGTGGRDGGSSGERKKKKRGGLRSRAERSRSGAKSRRRAIDPWNEGVSCGYRARAHAGCITPTRTRTYVSVHIGCLRM